MKTIIAPCPNCMCEMAGDHNCHAEKDCLSPPHAKKEIIK